MLAARSNMIGVSYEDLVRDLGVAQAEVSKVQAELGNIQVTQNNLEARLLRLYGIVEYLEHNIADIKQPENIENTEGEDVPPLANEEEYE